MVIGIPFSFYAFKLLSELPDCVSNIADDLNLRIINVVYGSRIKVYVNNRALTVHNERRFFNHIMTDIDYDISLVNGFVHVIICA